MRIKWSKSGGKEHVVECWGESLKKIPTGAQGGPIQYGYGDIINWSW